MAYKSHSIGSTLRIRTVSLVHGTRRPNATSTIRSKIAVISWYHRCALGFAVQLNTEHAIQLRGMDRTRPVRHAKDPVSIALLQTIRGRLHLSASHDKDI
ncbi:hypothetical protein H257_00258 [Aphanomyces astaci]|uniref:Uncharacterized protein n=1 Tax=Aphanomyces astaci TaxID=112090 RepID=W4HBU2_APHAT|nr:hypothetical protein H257_00258 [Aphanomyces astaci]ETV88744.1 hypothetical protein H257_00258 [Aphanomyces astaci]|eukprot:XP_009821144.1 hypothetical protein H257_00258 [Aphanomyces astaci]